ncbi:MAG: tRNA (N6-isopentenyl adenosine(37)-C2)-methylthiotransferase MiaB [Bdellovibrionales bacterium]|nr:tRNA (N6-isopentenyl adenosine(37)-C2)-methylthiotransferase MiaB [Bdellovibrionales bacterium]
MEKFSTSGPIKEKNGVFITTYGCQMNVNDTERMFSLLEMSNYTPVTSADQASLIKINSCSVREKPVHKVHSEVGRYRKLKEMNPNLKIGVAGCVAQQEKKRLIADIPLLDFVVGTDAIDQLPELVNKLDREKQVSARFEYQKPYQIETLIRNPGVSTFVNITKGCDNFCTFCVVPFTRGRERSRKAQELIQDIQKLVDRGVKEVTLLGQNVNSYKSECGADFADLLRLVATETNIQRIRYTTSHPKDFNQKLVDIMQEHREKVCEYIHLPVQSGNSQVLDRMNRNYTREEYIQKVKMIERAIPGVVLSTDIIVGFPGETDEQFEDTLSLLDEVSYESIYAFKYSPRPFTKAAQFTDQVDEQIKSERLNRLFAKHDEIARKLCKKYEGQTLEVLVEEVNAEGRAFGRSTQNKVVHFNGTNALVGQTVAVKVIEAFPQTMRGELKN